MNGQTNWIPGLITLGVGFVLALVGLFVSRRAQARAAAQTPGVAEDALETRYRGLIAQLKELELDKHQRTPEAYAAERARLEREAADVLRARDQARAAPRAPAPSPRPATGPLAARPRTRLALWAAAIVLFFGGVGYLLASELKGREAGGNVTGATPPGMAQQGAAPREEPELAEARQRYEANPSDLDAASLLTHELIRKGELEESHRIVQRALALDPFNVELRVHRGVLRAATGDMEGARKELEALVDAYPDAQEALLFLGAMSLRDGDRARALDYFERFQVEVPLQFQPPQLTQAIADLKAQVAQGGGR